MMIARRREHTGRNTAQQIVKKKKKVSLVKFYKERNAPTFDGSGQCGRFQVLWVNRVDLALGASETAAMALLGSGIGEMGAGLSANPRTPLLPDRESWRVGAKGTRAHPVAFPFRWQAHLVEDAMMPEAMDPGSLDGFS
jgi:hypothetical protein